MKKYVFLIIFVLLICINFTDVNAKEKNKLKTCRYSTEVTTSNNEKKDVGILCDIYTDYKHQCYMNVGDKLAIDTDKEVKIQNWGKAVGLDWQAKSYVEEQNQCPEYLLVRIENNAWFNIGGYMLHAAPSYEEANALMKHLNDNDGHQRFIANLTQDKDNFKSTQDFENLDETEKKELWERNQSVLINESASGLYCEYESRNPETGKGYKFKIERVRKSYGLGVNSTCEATGNSAANCTIKETPKNLLTEGFTCKDYLNYSCKITENGNAFCDIVSVEDKTNNSNKPNTNPSDNTQNNPSDSNEPGNTDNISGNPDNSNPDIEETPIEKEETAKIEGFCKEPKILNAFQFIGYILLIVKIVVPILLITFGSVDFVKAIISSDADALKKSTNALISRVIAGLVIFFLPTVINFTFDLVSGNKENNMDQCRTCIFHPSRCD